MGACLRAPLVVGVQTKPGKLPQHPEGAGRHQQSANHADPDEARVLRHGPCSRSVHVSIPNKIRCRWELVVVATVYWISCRWSALCCSGRTAATPVVGFCWFDLRCCW
ncbi:unnamed protein product [Ectocarpus sp. 13 AM-2016]